MVKKKWNQYLCLV